jgi:hypothetical protein
MIYSFKDRGEWFVVGEGVLLYDGIKEDHSSCVKEAEDDWSCCYHFSDFRIYSRFVSYNELKKNLSSFTPNARMVAHLNANDYTLMLKLTVLQKED